MQARTLSLFNPLHLNSFLKSPEQFFKTHFDPAESFYMVNAGIFKLCVLTSPDLAYHVIQEQNDSLAHGLGTGKMRKLTGNGVLTSQGPIHDVHRKMFATLFSSDQMCRWKELFSTVFDAHLKKLTRSGRLDWHEVARPMASEIVLQSFFGIRDSTELHRVQEVIEELLLLFTRPSLFQLQFSKKASLIRASVAKTLAQLVEAPPIFQLLPQGTSEEEKLDHAVSLILAGIDTLSWAFTWSAILLAHHPMWMESDDPKIVSAIVSESLRLYPTVWSITRNAVAKIDMKEGSLPAGTRFVVSLTILHRHPHFWKDPEQFDPNRFLNPEPKPRMAYAPFGVGGYSCLGLRFAMVAMETYIMMLTRYFRLSAAEPVPETRGSVTLTSRTPCFVSYRRVA